MISRVTKETVPATAFSQIHTMSKPGLVFSHAPCGFGEITESEAWLFPRCFMRDILTETRGSRHTRWSRDGSSLDYHILKSAVLLVVNDGYDLVKSGACTQYVRRVLSRASVLAFKSLIAAIITVIIYVYLNAKPNYLSKHSDLPRTSIENQI